MSKEPDRDDRGFAFVRRKGAALGAVAGARRARSEVILAPGREDVARGHGANSASVKSHFATDRRMPAGRLGLGPDDRARYIAVPGRTVPIGFARYVSPVVDPLAFEYYRVAGWRVAVPRSTPGSRTAELLRGIYKYGPQSFGYVRMGDTLVPAILRGGDRMALAQSAYFDADDRYPLSQ